MKVRELIDMLLDTNPNALIVAQDTYGETKEQGWFPIEGMIFSDTTVELTSENSQ